jgi:hypothetical protein
VRDSEINELTHHAMLVAWGQFAQSTGLIREIESVSFTKRCGHPSTTDQNPGVLCQDAGWMAHLKDLSRPVHPIDQGQAVAKAWLQPASADYSGVSRTLTTLRPEDAEPVPLLVVTRCVPPPM